VEGWHTRMYDSTKNLSQNIEWVLIWIYAFSTLRGVEGVMEKGEELDTIWKVPDDLWEEIEPIILELDPPKPTGRKRAHPRVMLNGIIYRMRSSCQWNQLPQELGDDSTIHRTFQRWEAGGLFPRIWTIIQSHCEELGGVDWEWQSADTALGKARFGGT
jgi:putative transposase